MTHTCHICARRAFGYRLRRWWCRNHAPPTLVKDMRLQRYYTSRSAKSVRTKQENQQ